MRAGSEEIKPGTHVQRLAIRVARITSQHGQIDGGDAAVAGDRRNVIDEQLLLVEGWVMRGRGQLVGAVGRRSVVEGKSASVRVDLGGVRIIENKKTTDQT